MRETRSSKCRYAVGWACLLLFLATISLGMLSTGCLVLTSERRNKPNAPRNLVKLHRNSDSLRYYRLFDCLDFDMDVGVESGPDRWQLAFLFDVLPVLFQSYESSATQPLLVDVQLEPKSPDITFNPWQIFFVGTNKVRVPPARVWQDQRFLGTNTLKAFPATNCTRFLLEFSPWDQVYPDSPDRDLPFQLCIEGLKVSGQTKSLPLITFKPTTFIRPGFRLPY